MSDQEIKKGDVVRIKDPNEFITSYAKKIADRDAVVEWVGPDNLGMNKGYIGVKFQKRNGRGKEFRERLKIRDVVLKDNT